jgi:hypothetical protein
LYSFKVITGTLVPEMPFSVEGSNKVRGKDTLMNCVIELECYPLALGPAQMVVTNASLHSLVYGDSGASSTWTNRMVITAANIPGTHDALTRLYLDTESGYYGVIVARDAGASLLNSPSYADYKVIPVGIYENALSRKYDVNVVSIGVGGVPTVKWRVNNGSYSSNIVLDTAFEVITLDSGGAFYSPDIDWTGVAPGTIYTFRNNQSSIVLNDTTNVYTNMATYMSEGGINLSSAPILVQPGVTGAYKILVGFFPAGFGNTYEVKIDYSVANEEAYVLLASTGWQRCPTFGSWLADGGILDLSPSGLRGSTHPKSVKQIFVNVYVRGIDVPTTGDTIKAESLFIVPASDPNSFIRTAWVALGDHVVMSNFDAEAPYIVSSLRGMFTDGTASVENSVVPAVETHEGNVITLIPGVTNTIVVYPLFSAFATRDFRTAIPYGATDRTTPRVDLAIRPRYMFVG